MKIKCNGEFSKYISADIVKEAFGPIDDSTEYKVNEASKLNKNDYKTMARHEITLNLDQICEIAKKLLKNNGILALVHRPERITDILLTMRKYNIEPKRIRFIHPKDNKDANIVLIEGRKNSRPGLKIQPPIISHQENGDYTKEVQEYFN